MAGKRCWWCALCAFSVEPSDKKRYEMMRSNEDIINVFIVRCCCENENEIEWTRILLHWSDADDKGGPLHSFIHSLTHSSNFYCSVLLLWSLTLRTSYRSKNFFGLLMPCRAESNRWQAKQTTLITIDYRLQIIMWKQRTIPKTNINVGINFTWFIFTSSCYHCLVYDTKSVKRKNTQEKRSKWE